MSQPQLLGVDIGTSGCKLTVFDLSGTALGGCTENYPVYYPREGWVEQEPEDWWNAVCAGSKKLVEKAVLDPAALAAIGLDGQGWAAVAIGKDGEVLTRNPIWLDTRAEDICQRLKEKVGEKEIFALCGNPLKAQYTTGKILWYKTHMPQVYAKTEKILQSNGFIAFRMTGELTQDLSTGYGLHCFDMRAARWDDAMCDTLGIKRSILPELVRCHEIVGRLREDAAAHMGLFAGVPVVAGGLDAACGTLGAGVINGGDTQEQGGQAGGMSICMDKYCADERLILGFHVVPDKWLLQGGTTGGGGAMRWFEEQFGDAERVKAARDGASSFAYLSDLAQSVPSGSDGLVFLPYMAGERSPIWDANAKGMYYGLDFTKTKAHMVRALMEGVAYSLKHNLDVAESAGAKVSVLRAMGGSANSEIWTQIKADVTGKTIEVPASDTATTLGAAILAGVAVGAFASFDEAVKKTVAVKRTQTPCGAQDAEAYKKGYETYLRLYSAQTKIIRA